MSQLEDFELWQVLASLALAPSRRIHRPCYALQWETSYRLDYKRGNRGSFLRQRNWSYHGEPLPFRPGSRRSVVAKMCLHWANVLETFTFILTSVTLLALAKLLSRQ